MVQISRNRCVRFCILMTVTCWHHFQWLNLYATCVLHVGLFLAVQVTWPSKYICDSRTLTTFPVKQMWPSSLSGRVRVSKIWWLGTFHSNNMVVKSLSPQLSKDRQIDWINEHEAAGWIKRLILDRSPWPSGSVNNLGTPCWLLPLPPFAMLKRLENVLFSVWKASSLYNIERGKGYCPQRCQMSRELLSETAVLD